MDENISNLKKRTDVHFQERIPNKREMKDDSCVAA